MPILDWKDRMDRAIEKGKQESINDKDALYNRLNTIEALLPHHPEEFAKILKNVIELLGNGLPIDCIQRILQRIQPTLSHAQPADLLLLKELERNFQALQAWSEDKRWLDWFSRIEEPSIAAAFLNALQSQSATLRTLPNELVQAGLMPSTTNNKYFTIRYPMAQWSLWTKCMDLFQQLPPNAAKLLLALLADGIKKLEDPQKIAHLLLMCKTITKPFNQRQTELLGQWWSLGLKSTDDLNPSLDKLLHMIVTLGSLEKESPSMNDLWTSMIQQGIQQSADCHALNNATQCLEVIKTLKDPLKSICCRYALEKKSYFKTSWLKRFEQAIELVPVVTSLEKEQQQLLDDAMKSSDIEVSFASLIKIKAMLEKVKKQAVSFQTLLQQLQRQKNLNQYLQAIENLFSRFYSLDESQQRYSTSILAEAIKKNEPSLSRDIDFLTTMANFDVNEPIWKTAYSLWNRTHCSSQELHEKIEFFVQVQPYIANIDPTLLDLMLTTGTPHQRQLMLAHVLPKVTDRKRISVMWNNLQTKPQFADANYVQQVIKAQTLVDKISQNLTDFTALLQFNDEKQREPRQLILSAMYHQEVTISSSLRQSWWSQYRNALSQWIFPPLNGTAKLNQTHHTQAIRTFDRLMKGIQEIKNIADPLRVSTDRGKPISGNLIQTITAYETTYSASWWKSRDRKKLATRLFQLTKEPTGKIRYSDALNTISEVMQGIIKNDQQHHGRNKKGYSRLYDIAIQLLSMTASEALPSDAEHKNDYVAQLKEIIRVQKTLCKSIDLDCTAFQHLQEVVASLDRVCGDSNTM